MKNFPGGKELRLIHFSSDSAIWNTITAIFTDWLQKKIIVLQTSLGNAVCCPTEPQTELASVLLFIDTSPRGLQDNVGSKRNESTWRWVYHFFGRIIMVKSGKFGRSAKFRQRPCLFHILTIGIKNK